VLSLGEESWGEVGLNKGFSGFFIVGEDISATEKQCNSDISLEACLRTHHSVD